MPRLKDISMTPIDVVKKYMDVFFVSKDWESLHEVFDVSMEFKGPLYEFNNAADYINALKASPIETYKYKILAEFENENSVCLIYEFSKEAKTTVMSQSFSFVGSKICNIRLIFDPTDLE